MDGTMDTTEGEPLAAFPLGLNTTSEIQKLEEVEERTFTSK
jgi:hypothetical protein